MDNHHQYEERSIYKYGLSYVRYHESLNRFIKSEQSKGNVLAFPEKEFQDCLLYNKEECCFMVYDIFGGRFQRRVKKLLHDGSQEAFDIDSEGKVLVYASG